MLAQEYEGEVRTRVQLPVPDRHVDQSLPIEWFAVTVNGEYVVINTAGEDSTSSYTIADVTRNPRVIAHADAVLWEGFVAHTRYEPDTHAIELSHPFAGVEYRLVVDEFLDERVPVLTQTQMVTLEGER